MLSRSAVVRPNAIIVRRVVLSRSARVPVRLQSISSTSSSSGFSSSKVDASHVAAGVAGGLTVVVAGYAWYHTSGLKTAVQSAKEIKKYLQSSRDSILSKASETAKNPSRALSNLRGIAKSYTFFVPGAEGHIDNTFDELDDLYETHTDEMDMILKQTMDDLIRATQHRRADVQTAKEVSSILGNGIRKMKDLGMKVGGDVLDRNPAVKEKLGSGYEQLKSLAEKAGPEGRLALKETRDRMRELVSKGKPDEGSIRRVQDLINEKTARLKRNVGGKEVMEEEGKKVKEVPESKD